MSSSLNNSLGILLFGMTSRFLLSCFGWTAMRIARAAISSKPDAVKKAVIRNTNYLKIWLGSYCLETGVSLLFAPGPYIVGKAVMRVMLDSFAPTLSDVLFKIDTFNHAGFLSFASTRLIRESVANNKIPSSSTSSMYGGANGGGGGGLYYSNSMVRDYSSSNSSTGNNTTSSNNKNKSSSESGNPVITPYNAANHAAASDVKNAFFWQLPALTLTLAKLFLRVHRIGMKRTRFFRCLGVAIAQYIARVPLMSFATMLPQSDSELIFCTCCIIIDKTSDAYLMYHTWPIPDVLSDAGISVPPEENNNNNNETSSKKRVSN
jgi:hypothetical protein